MGRFSTVKPVDGTGRIIMQLKQWKTDNPGKLYFDSEFERKCYILLEDNKMNFNFHPPARELAKGFSTWTLSKGKAKRRLFKGTVRNISYTPDFVIYCNNGTSIFIESKGYFDDASRIRYKLFQDTLASDEITLLVYDKENNKDLKAVIEIINEAFGGSTKDNTDNSQQIHDI